MTLSFLFASSAFYGVLCFQTISDDGRDPVYCEYRLSTGIDEKAGISFFVSTGLALEFTISDDGRDF